MFAADSRYASAATYPVTLAGGRVVAAVMIPAPRTATIAGYYPRPVSERLDLVAVRFLNAPTGFWQLCDANNAPVAGALGARRLIGIPTTATGGLP
ncbi:MAG TPA: hypothetical protein VHA57_10345 [Actinomycetota bacterium]|nr:hypothetical protein [Actinomycetota bacterium]